MSFDLTSKVLNAKIEDKIDFWVLVAIAHKINSNSKSYCISIKEIVRISHCCEKSVRNSIKKLVSLNVLEVQRQFKVGIGNLPNSYSLNEKIFDELYPQFIKNKSFTPTSKDTSTTTDTSTPTSKDTSTLLVPVPEHISNDKEDISSVVAHTDQNQGTNTGETQTLPSAKPMATQHTSSSENRLAGCPPCPVQQLVDLYHKTFPEGLRVVDITPKRRQAIKARWRRCYEDGDFKTKEEGLKAFEYFFVNKIRTSDFLMGRVWEKDRGPFQITLDYIFNRDTFAKIVENTYVNRQNNQG